MKNNPLKTLSKMSGLSQNDIKEIGRQVQANNDLLKPCKRHSFVDQTPDKQLGKTYKCLNCGGTVDAVKRMWYEIGLQHGAEMVKDDLK